MNLLEERIQKYKKLIQEEEEKKSEALHNRRRELNKKQEEELCIRLKKTFSSDMIESLQDSGMYLEGLVYYFYLANCEYALSYYSPLEGEEGWYIQNTSNKSFPAFLKNTEESTQDTALLDFFISERKFPELS